MWLSVLAIGLTFLLVANQPVPYANVFSNTVIHDPFTNLVKGVLLLSTGGCLAVSLQYVKKEGIHAYEYSILLLFALAGMMALVSSYDLITMYLAIELQSLSLYVLAAFKRNSAFSTEAGLKYFILGAFSQDCSCLVHR